MSIEACASTCSFEWEFELFSNHSHFIKCYCDSLSCHTPEPPELKGSSSGHFFDK